MSLYSEVLYKSMRGVRIGVPTAALQGAEAGVAAAFQQAVAAMRQAGAEVIEIETPTAADFDLAVGCGLIVSRAEAAAYHTVYGDRRQRYATTADGEQIDEASRVSAVHYLQAQRAREDLRWRMLRSFDSFDALLMPTTMAAPKSDESNYYSFALARNCILWSVLGFPAITLPRPRSPSTCPSAPNSSPPPTKTPASSPSPPPSNSNSAAADHPQRPGDERTQEFA